MRCNAELQPQSHCLDHCIQGAVILEFLSEEEEFVFEIPALLLSSAGYNVVIIREVEIESCHRGGNLSWLRKRRTA